MTTLTGDVPTMYHRTGIACQHRSYYMTCEDFDELWTYAEGCCQICRTPEAQTKRGKLCIDHLPNYGQGCVRGLLCDKCNALMHRVDTGATGPSAAVIRYQRNAWFALHVMSSRGFYVNRKYPRWEWKR